MGLANTAAGVTIGSAIAPGIGTLIGGGIGLLTDIFSGASASKAQKEAQKLERKAKAAEYRTRAAETGIQIAQTTSDISAYESFLSDLPVEQEVKRQQYEANARTQFKGLLSNMGLADVAVGVVGRSGASAQAIGTEAETELQAYTGADQQLGGGDGGLYELEKTSLENDLEAEQMKYENQLDVYRTTLTTLQSNKVEYEKLANMYQPDMATLMANMPHAFRIAVK
jgi:hypothetical protein